MAINYVFPPNAVTVSPPVITVPPIQYVKNGSPVDVEEDTADQTNSEALPVALIDNVSGQKMQVLDNPNTVRKELQVHDEEQLQSLGSIDSSLQTIAQVVKDVNTTAPTFAVLMGMDDGTNMQSVKAGQQASADSLAAVLSTEQEQLLTDIETNTNTALVTLGLANDAAAGSDTADTGFISLFKRNLQKLTSLIALFPSSIGQKTKAGSLSVVLASDSDALPVSAASLPLPTGASTLAEQQTQSTRIGDVTETAPGTDTASSGLNGRLQRIAQRITSLIALFPSALGQTTMANSFAVTIASDQSALSVTQTALTATFQEDATVSTVAETFTAPAGAKSCVIQAPSSNTVNLRIKIGGTASTTSGMVLEPGRSETFPFAGNISYCSESGSGQAINVHFGA